MASGQRTSRLSDVVARLSAVSLDEVDARSGLQRRVDNKYLVTWPQLERLVDALADDHEALEIEGRRVFRYESVYFDTPALDSFRDHVAHRTPRTKIRSRLYVDSGEGSFELKVKLPEGETAKAGREHGAPADHGRISPAIEAFLREQLGRLTDDDGPGPLEPTLITRFERATIAARSGAERITCDAGVELARPGGRAVRLVDDRVLVETKTESGDERADRVLREAGIEPVSFSKYRAGIGMLVARDPEPQLGGAPERWFAPVRPG
jgi:hypothetical protein